MKKKLELVMEVRVVGPKSTPSSDTVKFVHEVVCRDCGEFIGEDRGFLPEQRTKCHNCGSMERKYPQLARSYNSGIAGKMKAVTSEPRKGRPAANETSGASYFKSEGRWVWRNVEIDRQRDYYREIVLDPESGVVLHYCEEPLSEHRSCGSAKPWSMPDDT